jgi:hypothetical protein
MPNIVGFDHALFRPRYNFGFEHARFCEINFEKLLKYTSGLILRRAEDYPRFLA